MQITTAPTLFFGLGIRIFLNKFLFHYENISIGDFVLLGLWQGTAVYYLLMQQVEFAWAAAVGILGRLLFDFGQDFDTTKCAGTLLGVALGVLATDILSQFIEDDSEEGHRSGEHHRTSRRLVQFSRTRIRDVRKEKECKEKKREKDKSREKERNRERDKMKGRMAVEDLLEAPSIITANSISSSSDLVDPKRKLTPFEREVANLRAKASLADTERRRFKEEKKWALSQGNHARAAQMRWQVKRYTALMESFHREADIRLLEASGVKSRRTTGNVASQKAPARHSVHADRHNDHPTVVNIDFGNHNRKRSFGTLKPTIRVQGREIKDPGSSNPPNK